MTPKDVLKMAKEKGVRIVDLRFPVPELRRKPALNLQVIQLQLNHASSLRKISANIPHANIKAGDFAAVEL